MEMQKEINYFIELFSDKNENKIQFVIPPYQRAYSWEETQWNQFVQDLIDFKERKEGYYFGHYIFESDNNGTYYLIDGQQRFTTFILFLIVCRFYLKSSIYDNYISKLEIVKYDHLNFMALQEYIQNNNEWNMQLPLTLPEPPITLSLNRIISALNYFHLTFEKKQLDIKNIHVYIEIITKSHISVHRTRGKDVSVQIFELHNTRGVRLNTIEKVKAKLMKAVYNSSKEKDETEHVINEIQNEFAEIFKLEEQTANSSFRGELALDEILFSHLRVIDDGFKDENNFNSPARSGNREEQILKYIDERLKTNTANNCIEYSKNLSREFRKSLVIMCENLLALDQENSIIGDVLILEKDISCEFFLILLRCLNMQENNNNLFDVIYKWEKLLFTRDFHDRYYRQWYRDDFQKLFIEISNEPGEINALINRYIEKGFRPDKMDENNLQKTYCDFIENNKELILKNAFNWWQEKMVYVLYKYEKSILTDLEYLRKIMKKGRSIEHILPQEWQWEWVNEKPESVSEKGHEFAKLISQYINGIGNLLLISGEENSSMNNNHPEKKEYKCGSGSYKEHEEKRDQWKNHAEWKEIITNRGKKIYEFMTKYFSPFRM